MATLASAVLKTNPMHHMAQALLGIMAVNFNQLPGTTTLIHDSDSEVGSVVYAVEEGEVFDIRQR